MAPCRQPAPASRTPSSGPAAEAVTIIANNAIVVSIRFMNLLRRVQRVNDLPQQFQSDLTDARIAGGQNSSEVRRRRVGDRGVEVHLVERVEQLATELKPYPLASWDREQSRNEIGRASC